jgi:hypothetical protein
VARQKFDCALKRKTAQKPSPEKSNPRAIAAQCAAFAQSL